MPLLKLSQFYIFILCGFLLLIYQSDGKLRFTEEPSNPTYVVKGGKARLRWNYECTGTGGCTKELFVASWHSKNVIFVEVGMDPFRKRILLDGMRQYSPSAFGNDLSLEERKRYLGRVSLSNNNTLVITGITEEDLKINYTCTLALKEGGEISSQVNIKLAVPPRIRDSSQPQLQELHRGQAKLSCETDGEPEPFITWLKEGRVVKNSTNQTTLMVRDKGSYECRASNMAGSDKYQIKVVDQITSGDTTPTSGTTVSNGASTEAMTDSGNSGLIVAAIVVPLFLSCLVVGIVLWFFCRKRKERRAAKSSNKSISELVDSKYEPIHMDEYKSVREKSFQQSPLEKRYVKDITNISNQNDSVNGHKGLPESVAYTSVGRKFPMENIYASADKKTPQPSNMPLDEYAQVDMSKKKKKQKPGELLYVQLDIADSNDITSNGERRKKPSAEPTMYAEVQFE